jgi:REP element-mobilizing transposase RayT
MPGCPAGCAVLAIIGMPDHVHLVLQTPTILAPARLMQRVKGISSTFARDHFDLDKPFGWQDNYAVFSFSHSHLKRVIT